MKLSIMCIILIEIVISISIHYMIGRRIILLTAELSIKQRKCQFVVNSDLRPLNFTFCSSNLVPENQVASFDRFAFT